MQQRRERRVGLSRLDVVVVLLLLLVGLGLFLAFLARQREHGHRLVCLNNLKRIGEGIHSFHKAQRKAGAGYLPPARIADGYATWAVLLIPHVTRDHPLATWELALPFVAQDEKLRTDIVPLYFCPARGRTKYVSDDGGLGDYAGAAGDANPMFDWTGPQANGSIVLGETLQRDGDRIVRWRGRVSFGDLTRGLSNTFLAGEKHVPSMAHGMTEFGDGSIYDGRFPGNFSRVAGPGAGLAQSPNEPYQHNFGSSHVGMCPFLVADGSVRTVANSIDTGILARLLVRE